MDNLPFVVLQTLLLQVKLKSGTSHNDLLVCSLVSKTWHHAAIPFLYGIIVLDMPQADPFMQCFDTDKYSGYVLSLTVRIESEETNVGPEHLHDMSQSVKDERLLQFVPILRRMSGFVCLSIYTRIKSILLPPHGTITALLDALPETCRGVELEIWNHDKNIDPKQPSRPHVCDALRRALPQMACLRLRLVVMCSAMFGVDDGFDTGFVNTPAELPGPVVLPNLRSMVINCGYLDKCVIQCCYKHDRIKIPRFNITTRITAWRSLTNALEQVVEKGMPRGDGLVEGNEEGVDEFPWQLHPEDVKIVVVAPTFPSFFFGERKTWLRADMVNRETLAIPHLMVATRGNTPYNLLIRLPDGSEKMVTKIVGESLVEGEAGNWCDLVNGARLLREILTSSYETSDMTFSSRIGALAEMCGGSIGLVMTKWRTVQEVRQVSNVSSRAWLNEDLVGLRLIGAERRVGKDEYLSFKSLREMVPEGWKRVDGGGSRRLDEPRS
ncbi:hypothetical protein QQX98_012164 [Neonectria punicea]|uniref:F-box domain-containing protein n=1 Tax=Neonectria punicea TaxID=979145 RepID=A0ABR1GJL6_9HYPO